MCLSVLEALDKNLEIDSESTDWITTRFGAGIANGTNYRERLVAIKVKHDSELTLKDTAMIDHVKENTITPMLESMGASGADVDMFSCIGSLHHHQHLHIYVK